MKIINGLECRGRVDSLVELEDLVELTRDGFRPVRSDTLNAVAARLREAEVAIAAPLSMDDEPTGRTR